MAKRDTKFVEQIETDAKKQEKEEARTAAREFWANQRINQTDEPQPSKSRGMRM